MQGGGGCASACVTEREQDQAFCGYYECFHQSGGRKSPAVAFISCLPQTKTTQFTQLEGKKKGRGEKPEHVSLRDDNNGKALEAKGKKKISGFVARNVGSALEG